MSLAAIMIDVYRFNRERTLSLLDSIEQSPDAQTILAWRPGPGRAHIGWQLMHIGVTEEIFATERLAPEKPGQWTDLASFSRRQHPDDDIPSSSEIRQVLSGSARAADRHALALWRRSARRNSTA